VTPNSDSRTIGIGVLGYGFMGRVHSEAFQRLAGGSLTPRLVGIAGRDDQALAAVAQRYGYEQAVTDWRELIADDRIQLFDNVGSNDAHAEPTIAAAEAGKHVLCEKPLGRTATESYEIWQKVVPTGVKHLCGFNYRFVPAVRLARELLDAGELGEVRHFRASYLKDSAVGPARTGWRYDPESAGSGVLGDLGSHVVDLARYLAGEIASVSALVRTFVEGRHVDDAVEAVVEFEGGAVGTIEATKLALGRRNAFRFELNGSSGSIAFDLERMNELELFRDDGDRARGFKQVLVSERDHPFWSRWWPPGHTIGWAETFVHELDHLLTAIAGDCEVGPHGATFEDGYRAAEVCEAMLRASGQGRRELVRYRNPQEGEKCSS
jgi:predicted dehydrogenase